MGSRRPSYLQQQLVLCDPLDRFDEVGVDGVGQPPSLLDVLLKGTEKRENSPQKTSSSTQEVHLFLHINPQTP